LVLGVAPLRERVDDIPLLVSHLMQKAPAILKPEHINRLKSMPWMGNVRELRNFVERVRALGPDDAFAMMTGATGVAPASTPPMESSQSSPPVPPPPSPVGPAEAAGIDFDRPYKEVREDWIDYLERAYFKRLLDRYNRNVAEAAQAAGVDRTYVYRLIRRYDL
jgi:DNA-binding NtrC family response regulator